METNNLEKQTDKRGNINHSVFYGYRKNIYYPYTKTEDRSYVSCEDITEDDYYRLYGEDKSSWKHIEPVCEEIKRTIEVIDYSKPAYEETVDLEDEINMLRQAVYEQQQTIMTLQNQLNKICSKPKYADLCT